VCIANYQLPIENGTFIWGCTFPIFYYLLLGKKCGLINSTVFFAIHLFITISKIGFSPDQISNMLVLNMAVCYLLVWFTSHIFESNREKSELNLSVLAAKDALTNTYNRLALNHQFPLLQKHDNAPLSLLILDIDFFKQINDQFGHSVGDKVLIETAIVLKKIIGESQVFRIGGEEFCITLPHTDLNQAENFAEALRQSIADHHYKTVDHPIQLTVSIGVCECSSDIELDDVLVKADIELYRAKKNGRNQVMVCSEQKQYEVLSEQSPISSATR
jgi:diguanylate cyclase (GGDEF)-like protein